jgi:hypothetical protein
LSANDCIHYQNEEIGQDSMIKLGVLGKRINYPQLVNTVMTEFDDDLDGKTGAIAAKKAVKTQIEAHKKARGKLCRDFVNGLCILCNTKAAESVLVTSSNLIPNLLPKI